MTKIQQRIEALSLAWGRNLLRLVPLSWSILFFFGAVLVIVFLSFSKTIYAVPPFTKLLAWNPENFTLHATFYLENYKRIFENPLYLTALLSSLKLSLISTGICLIIGYPLAYGITLFSAPLRTTLLMLVVLPMWTAFLIRIYAWINLLSSSGLLNSFLLKIGLITTPLPLMNTSYAVVIGLVYCYLPFMILPLYSTLERLDRSLLQAASDLGCRPFKAFLKVTLPLSKSGIWGGTLLVFIPMVGEFVIPELLGGNGVLLIGKMLWVEFFYSHDWPLAAALSVVLLLVLLIPMILLKKRQQEESLAR